MSEDLKVNLDAPSIPDPDPFEEEAVNGEVAAPSVAPQEETPAETVVEEKDPPRIPYSRFETVHERAIKAEAELELLRKQNQPVEEPIKFQGDLPEKWVKLYGDNDASREAYGLYRNGIKEEFSSMREQLIEEIRQQEAQREEQAEKAATEWETTIDDFAAKHSRSFSEAEKEALLDVMDELTPKDDQQNYLVPPIRYLSQAVELHDLRNQSALAKKNEAKRKAAGLAGAKSEGEPQSQADWTGDWRRSPLLRG